MEMKKLSYYINQAKIINQGIYDKKVRIAFLGSFTLNGFEETIQVQCSEEKINCITYNAPYNQYNQEILNKNSDLYKFNPDIIFFLIDNRTILDKLFYFPYEYSEDDRRKFTEEKYSELENLIKTITEKLQSKIIITNFVIPTYSPFGIFESKVEFGLKDIILDLNKKLKELCKNHDSVYLYDFNSFVTKFGEKNVLDYKKMFFGDIKISFDTIPYVSHIGYLIIPIYF